ncbi:hypothetical protein [Actinomadura rupiterrae]|uniref:hypothetical protein n=1 Tax=Actinomadura rupiterrae TaxID=559627 RepID=UPI0020A2C433|nr:hypothetical protein [Actinomadura rupiterrae]MCP2341184.1 hypothetical protein [Actinomadura rupiterrae]
MRIPSHPRAGKRRFAHHRFTHHRFAQRRFAQRRAAALLGLGILLTSTVTGLLAAGPALPANAGCAPAWKLETPPLAATDVQDAQALSAKDVRFTANIEPGWGGGMSESVWDGSKVTAAGPQIPHQPKRLAFSGGRSSYDSPSSGWALVAPGGGWGDITTTVMGRWDGTRWTLVPGAVSPAPATGGVRLNDVASLAPGDAWAVGDLEGNGAFVEHWDGTEWKAVDNPGSSIPTAQLMQVSASSANDVWAVGFRRLPNGGATVPYTLHYDGAKWTEVTMPDVGAPDAVASAVVAKGPNDVYVGGWRGTWAVWNDYKGLVMHWDGQKWSVDTGPGEVAGGGFMDSLYVAGPNDLWAVSGAAVLHRTGATWTKVAPEGAQPGGEGSGITYYYRALTGTGPNDVWAVGMAISTDPSPTPGTALASIHTALAHLTCGGK